MRGLAAKTGQEIGVNVAQKAMEKLRRRLGKGYDNSYSEDQAKGYEKATAKTPAVVVWLLCQSTTIILQAGPDVNTRN